MNILDRKLQGKILVTGVAGVAGYNALHYFSQRFPGQVIGMRRADNWMLSGENIVGIEGDDLAAVRSLFEEHQFRVVLNCEGTCKLKSCEFDPAMAQRVNVDNVETLIRAMAPETRFIHLSIDLVFSGIGQGGYSESDPTDPVTVYGKTMVDAEQLVQAERPDACILRISLPMGISFNGHAGAIDWIQHRFKNNRPATLYFDEVRTPTYTDCLNPVLEELIFRPEISGLYHSGGPRRLSLYQIAQIVNRIGNYDPNLLIGCFRVEAGPMPPRAGNVTMDSTRLAQKLGFTPFVPWPLSEEHVPGHIDWHHQRTDGAGPEFLAANLYCRPEKVGARTRS